MDLFFSDIHQNMSTCTMDHLQSLHGAENAEPHCKDSVKPLDGAHCVHTSMNIRYMNPKSLNKLQSGNYRVTDEALLAETT